MSKPLKRKRRVDLPYWPSAEFISKAVQQCKDKGMKGADRELEEKVYQAYWQTRVDLLAKHKQ